MWFQIALSFCYINRYEKIDISELSDTNNFNLSDHFTNISIFNVFVQIVNLSGAIGILCNNWFFTFSPEISPEGSTILYEIVQLNVPVR